jgi:O-antigen/teichoic acid export membrane protein
MIARKSFLIVISHFLIQIIGWIGLVIIAKLWGEFAPEVLGIIGFAMSFLAIFNIVADLGFTQAHIKRVSEGKDLGTCIGTYIAIKLSLIVIMVTVVFVSLFIWKEVFQGGFHDATTESTIFVFLLYYIFLNLSSIPINTFTGTREIAKRQIPAVFGRIIKIPLIILVALAGVSIVGISPAIDWPQFLQPLQRFISDHAIGSLAMTYAFDMMIIFFIGMWFLRKYPIKKPNWELFKSYFTFAMPIMLFSVIGVISLNIDKIMIGYFWTSVEVGYYFTIQQVLQIITVFYIAVSIVLLPTISQFHSSRNHEKIKKTTLLAERYISMIMIPPIIVVIVLANSVINIMLDKTFLPAASVLITLAIYIFIFSINRPYESLISGINRPGISTKIGLLICFTNIPLNYLFIPENGLLSSIGINGPTGAAVATVISTLVGFFGLRYSAKKLSGIKLLQTHTPRHIIAGLIMGLVLYLLAFQITIFPTIHWYHLLMFAGLGLGVYLGILYILKEFNKKDLHFYLDIIHPKEMLKYISSELREKPKKK